jgi:AAA+ ATPase superfamily predicted ATPase
MTFHDREEELSALTTAFETPNHEFYVVYGRRRVGKTELLKEFCRGYPHIYFLAAQEAEERQREEFVEHVADYFGDRVPRIDGWDDAFEYLGEKVVDQDVVIAIDEFP